MSIIHDWLYKNQPMNLRFHQQEPGPTNRQSCWERKVSEPPHIGLRRPKCWCCLCRCFQIIGAMIFRWVFGWCPTVPSILMLQILIQSCPNFARLLFLLLRQIQCARCNIYKAKQLWMFWGYTPKKLT